MPWLAVIFSVPRGAVMDVLERLFGRGQARQHVAHRGVEQLAFVGEGQAAGMALEQRRGDLFFQRADLAADRRLAEASASGRHG